MAWVLLPVKWSRHSRGHLLALFLHQMNGSRPPRAHLPAKRLLGPTGNGNNNNHREDGSGVVTTLLHSPVKGTNSGSPVLFPRFHGPVFDVHSRVSHQLPHHTGHLPKMHFPSFDGENTRLWISRAENYFDMYTIDPTRCVKVSGMHFTGLAARWIQSIDSKLKSLSWPEFCKLLHDWFGRDQHEILLRQLFHIKQTTTVVDYVDRFAALMDHLAPYDSCNDMLYFTTRFVDGLRDDIRVVIVVQRPLNLDTTYTLSLLQEEMADSTKRRTFYKYDHTPSTVSGSKGAHPLPRPPSLEKSFPEKAWSTMTQYALDDKLSALRAFRHAKGLCERCAEKWTRGHMCSTTIQLQAMQEVWDLFNIEEGNEAENNSPITAPASEDLFLTLSVASMSGQQTQKKNSIASLCSWSPRRHFGGFRQFCIFSGCLSGNTFSSSRQKFCLYFY